MTTPLKPGCVVYRVVEYDLPDDGARHTWKVASVVVETASAKQIRLKTPFNALFSTRFKPDALGRTFFETPLQAIQHFLIAHRLEIESFDRQRAEAERAIAWAKDQEGMKPIPHEGHEDQAPRYPCGCYGHDYEQHAALNPGCKRP